MRIVLSGVVCCEDVIQYEEEESGISYSLPPSLKNLLSSLRTKLEEARYDPSSDECIVSVKPPFIPRITMRHTRLPEQ